VSRQARRPPEREAAGWCKGAGHHRGRGPGDPRKPARLNRRGAGFAAVGFWRTSQSMADGSSSPQGPLEAANRCPPSARPTSRLISWVRAPPLGRLPAPIAVFAAGGRIRPGVHLILGVSPTPCLFLRANKERKLRHLACLDGGRCFFSVGKRTTVYRRAPVVLLRG